MGWKTYASGLLLIGIGVGMAFKLFTQEDARFLVEIAAGLGLIGLGHKLDKLRQGE